MQQFLFEWVKSIRRILVWIVEMVLKQNSLLNTPKRQSHHASTMLHLQHANNSTIFLRNKQLLSTKIQDRKKRHRNLCPPTSINKQRQCLTTSILLGSAFHRLHSLGRNKISVNLIVPSQLPVTRDRIRQQLFIRTCRLKNCCHPMLLMMWKLNTYIIQLVFAAAKCKLLHRKRPTIRMPN